MFAARRQEQTPLSTAVARLRAALAPHEATTTNLCLRDPVVVPRAAANALPVPGGIVFCHPSAAAAIRKRGGAQIEVVPMEQPELARADGALTCGCVVLDPFFDWRSFS